MREKSTLISIGCDGEAAVDGRGKSIPNDSDAATHPNVVLLLNASR